MATPDTRRWSSPLRLDAWRLLPPPAARRLPCASLSRDASPHPRASLRRSLACGGHWPEAVQDDLTGAPRLGAPSRRERRDSIYLPTLPPRHPLQIRRRTKVYSAD